MGEFVGNNKNNEDESTTSSVAATIITKPAKTDYPISDLIAKRWSARAFSTRTVEASKLLKPQDGLHLHATSSLGFILYLQMIILKG